MTSENITPKIWIKGEILANGLETVKGMVECTKTREEYLKELGEEFISLSDHKKVLEEIRDRVQKAMFHGLKDGTDNISIIRYIDTQLNGADRR